MLEQDVNFIDINPSIPAKLTIPNYPIKDTVQHHQHTNRKKLLAQITDVIAENLSVCIYICRLCKGIQTALCKQLNCQRYIFCFGFGLPEEFGVKVLQCRCFSLIIPPDIITIDIGSTAVDNGFFFCGELPGTDELFAE